MTDRTRGSFAFYFCMGMIGFVILQLAQADESRLGSIWAGTFSIVSFGCAALVAYGADR